MKVLAIETSCDETACAIVEGGPSTRSAGSVRASSGLRVLANVVASSEEMHKKSGGIIPEIAAREQLASIIPVIQESINVSRLKSVKEIDAIAVTVGPGLVGSLLVGVETAKALAYAWEKPIIPVNHLIAHLYANFVENSKFEALRSRAQGRGTRNSKQISNTKFEIPKFPAIGLVVSGGHTDLVSITESKHKSIKISYLGGTRDDAAGECLDKCARLLGLPYPGGPAIAAEAAKFLKRSDHVDKQQGPTLPRPLMHEETWDFSFSGLKTAVAREVNKLRIGELQPQITWINRDYTDWRAAMAYEIQEAVVEVLVSKLERAVREFRPKSLILGGGVAANSRLRESLKAKCKMLKANLFVPPKELCTDNAVMIGAAGFYHYYPIPWQQIQVEPGLEIG